MLNILLILADSSGSQEIPTMIGKVVGLTLFALGALKCFLVARKPRVQKLGLISLGLILLMFAIMNAATAFGLPHLVVVGIVMVGFLCAIVSMTLGILGIIDFQRHRENYDCGRTQAVFAILISLGLLSLAGYGIYKALVEQIKDAPVANSESGDGGGQHYDLTEFNLRFANPGSSWISLNPKSMNPIAELVLRQRRPEQFLMVVPEIYGADMELTVAGLGEVVRANMIGFAPGMKVSEPVSFNVSGFTGERFTATGMVGKVHLHYESWYGLANGLSVQVVAFSAVKDREGLDRIQQDFLAGMQLIDPDKVFTASGELIDEVLDFPEHGFSLSLPARSWMVPQENTFAETVFRATSLGGGNFHVIRIDLHGHEADADPIESALLHMQDLRIDDVTVVSKVDRESADGTRVRDLVIAFEEGESKFSDYYRIHQKKGQVIVANVWNESPPDDGSWQPEAILDGLTLHEEIPSLNYEELSAERRAAQCNLLNAIGLYYYRKEYYAVALPFFRAATLANPEDEVIATNVYEALWQLGHLEKALEETHKLSLAFPESDAVKATMARTLVALERPAEAELIYAALFEKGYDGNDDLLDYINLLVNQDREDSAYELISREVERRPLQRLLIWKGQVARLAGEYREAEAAFTKAAESEGWDSKLFSEMVSLYQTEGEHQKALEWLDRQESQTGLTFDVCVARGQSQAELGQVLGAIISYKEALRIRPGDEDVMDRLARLDESLHEEPLVED